jgi:sulfate/thiosulfate transport system ATP-binding protein
VMTFVGAVNIFHGRVQNGKAFLGSLAVDYPAHFSSEAREAVGYARPHDLELSRDRGEATLPATVREARVSGALAKVEVVADNEMAIQVELGREQYEQLHLSAGDTIYITPRRLRVFT